jgi:hypothetical protein
VHKEFRNFWKSHLEDREGDGRKMSRRILTEVGCEDLKWIKLAQDRFVSSFGNNGASGQLIKEMFC